LKVLGFNAADVTKVVIGHAHWTMPAKLSDLPMPCSTSKREELKASSGRSTIRSRTIRRQLRSRGCNRTPACGYMPLTIEEVYGKVLKASVIVDGETEILPGVRIHPAFRAHTAGSQLLEVRPASASCVRSDAFSSYEGIRDWMTANVQQTDTSSSFSPTRSATRSPAATTTASRPRAAELHGQISADEEFLGGAERRTHAEIALAPGEKSRKPMRGAFGWTSLPTPTASSWDWKKKPIACVG